MTESDRIKYLRVALLIVGLIFTFGLWPLTIVWPSGWAWHAGGRSDYLEMIFGIYATLGVFLMIASRDPMAHKSLIWFTVWSSFVHGAIMAVQSIADIRHIGHLWGDVLALIVVGAVLAALMPRRTTVGLCDEAGNVIETPSTQASSKSSSDMNDVTRGRYRGRVFWKFSIPGVGFRIDKRVGRGKHRRDGQQRI